MQAGTYRGSTTMIKLGLFVSMLLLVQSCSTNKYLGTKQPNLAANACSIETKQCFMLVERLDSNGAKTTLRGSYFLGSVEGGTYLFRGSAKLDHEMREMSKIKYLDLTFVFFKGDIVVHEEKIRLRGSIGEYLEFSKLIKSGVTFDSSKWAWYNWRARE